MYPVDPVDPVKNSEPLILSVDPADGGLSLEAAQSLARRHAGQRPVEIVLEDGIHYLAETFVLTPADSGTGDAPVVYRARNEGKAVLSGGFRLDLNWEAAPETGPGVFKAATPPDLALDQLFINGGRQRMARYPTYNPDTPTAAYQGFAADAFSRERAARWSDPGGGYIHAMHRHRWGGCHYRITGKNAEGDITYEGGWQNNRQMGMHERFRMVENIFEELDAPGEWFHHRKTHTLYCIPEAGTDLSRAVVEGVRLPCLIAFRGTRETPVRHITLQGITFRHSARTFMETREPLLRSDWAIHRGGAVLLEGTEEVSIRDSRFDQVGGNAVFVNNYNRGVLIRGCHIFEAGASGICFVGDPGAVRNPLFEYAESNDLRQIDRRPGPRTEKYPSDSAVEDCLIHGIGRVERQSAAVQLSISARITVRDTSIYDTSRAGINIGDGTWGGHLIERVDVFDTVLETHDHGSFNSWGRDRYWVRNHIAVSQPEVHKDPALPFLDAVEPTVIRHSRWRCDHGWDIDLDDGSTHYDIHHNLLLAGGLKLREGYRRRATNNILLNNGLHPHVWFADSGDAFTRNIVMAPHAPVRPPPGWGGASDHNLFAFEIDLGISQQEGADPHSISGDPMFVDPASGDFRVREGSPSLETGFENFPMDQFGVKKPSLRAIARTPKIPELRNMSQEAAAEPARQLPQWMGMGLQDLEGEAFSAFGVRKEDGGVQLLAVRPNSGAVRQGLQADDLIQAVNGQSVHNARELLSAAARPEPGPLRVRIIRNQRPVDLLLHPDRADTAGKRNGLQVE